MITGLRLDILESPWGATLDEDVERVFVKSGYVLGALNLLQGYQDRNHNLSRKRGSAENRCSWLSERWNLELGKLLINIFFCFRRRLERKAPMCRNYFIAC